MLRHILISRRVFLACVCVARVDQADLVKTTKEFPSGLFCCCCYQMMPVISPAHLLDVLVVTYLLHLKFSLVKATCQPTKKSQWNSTLENSAYNSSHAQDYPTCLKRCMADESLCASLSYDLITQTCDLSRESRWSHPDKYKQKEYSIYVEMVGVVEKPVVTAVKKITTEEGKTSHTVFLAVFKAQVLSHMH